MICTDPSLGMDTTVGTFALVGAKTKGNAPIVDQACHHHIAVSSPFLDDRNRKGQHVGTFDNLGNLMLM